MTTQGDSRKGLVDWPDGKDWRCTLCGATVLDSDDLEHDCDGQLERVNRAYFWPGGRSDVVVEMAGPPIEGSEEHDDD